MGSSVSALTGDGSGAFGTAMNIALPGGSQAIAVGDINADGQPDTPATPAPTTCNGFG